MARRLWGCYSVSDHMRPRAFVADLLLYDRLVIPVPAASDMALWEKHWNPERQARLLEILGPYAAQVEWSADLKKRANAHIAGGAHRYSASRRVISEDLFEHAAKQCSPARARWQLNDERTPGNVFVNGIGSGLRQSKEARSVYGFVKDDLDKIDVRAIAVYCEPDRFDRAWVLTRPSRFPSRATKMVPGAMRRAVAQRQGHESLARAVVTRLVVPDDGADDEEVLRRTVDVVSRADVSQRRAEFHHMLATLEADGMSAPSAVREVEAALEAYNEATRRHTSTRRTRIAVHLLTAAEALASLHVPDVAVAAGPTVALGEAWIRRREPAETSESALQAVALLADARRAL